MRINVGKIWRKIKKVVEILLMVEQVITTKEKK